MAEATDFNKTISDAAYVAVGFGVIAFQKAQVRRREIEARLGFTSDQLIEQLTKVAGEVEERIEPLVEAALSTAKDAGGQLRTLLSDLHTRGSAA